MLSRIRRKTLTERFSGRADRAGESNHTLWFPENGRTNPCYLFQHPGSRPIRCNPLLGRTLGNHVPSRSALRSGGTPDYRNVSRGNGKVQFRILPYGKMMWIGAVPGRGRLDCARHFMNQPDAFAVVPPGIGPVMPCRPKKLLKAEKKSLANSFPSRASSVSDCGVCLRFSCNPTGSVSNWP